MRGGGGSGDAVLCLAGAPMSWKRKREIEECFVDRKKGFLGKKTACATRVLGDE